MKFDDGLQETDRVAGLAEPSRGVKRAAEGDAVPDASTGPGAVPDNHQDKDQEEVEVKEKSSAATSPVAVPEEVKDKASAATSPVAVPDPEDKGQEQAQAAPVTDLVKEKKTKKEKDKDKDKKDKKDKKNKKEKRVKKEKKDNKNRCADDGKDEGAGTKRKRKEENKKPKEPKAAKASKATGDKKRTAVGILGSFGKRDAKAKGKAKAKAKAKAKSSASGVFRDDVPLCELFAKMKAEPSQEVSSGLRLSEMLRQNAAKAKAAKSKVAAKPAVREAED